MKSDNHYAIKHLTAFFELVTFTIFTVSGQSSAGILKIFSNKPLVVYVDELHCPQYSEIQLVSGTIYTSGPLGAEAQARKLRLHGYDYKKSFKDNYFSN